MVLYAFDHELQGALGKGDLSGKTHQVLVPDAGAYARGLKQVLQVVHFDQVERGIDRLQLHPLDAGPRGGLGSD